MCQELNNTIYFSTLLLRLVFSMLPYSVYRYCLHIKIIFRVRSEYFLLMIRESIPAIYFFIIAFLYSSGLYLLNATICSSIMMYYIVLCLFCKRTFPRVLYICDYDKHEQAAVKTSYTISIRSREKINESALSIAKQSLDPDAILLNNVSLSNLKTIARLRKNEKILIQTSDQHVRDLMLKDFFPCIGHAQTDTELCVGVMCCKQYIIQDLCEQMYDSCKQVVKIDKAGEVKEGLDVLIIPHLIYVKDQLNDQNLIDSICHILSTCNRMKVTPVLLTPIVSYASDMIPKHEIIFQQSNADTRIIRLPNIIRENDHLKSNYSSKYWQHIDHIAQYLLCIIPTLLKEEQYIHTYVHGHKMSQDNLIEAANFIRGLI